MSTLAPITYVATGEGVYGYVFCAIAIALTIGFALGYWAGCWRGPCDGR